MPYEVVPIINIEGFGDTPAVFVCDLVRERGACSKGHACARGRGGHPVVDRGAAALTALFPRLRSSFVVVRPANARNPAQGQVPERP